MSLINEASRAGVAQLVEQRTCNAKVEGSTPFSGTTFSGQNFSLTRPKSHRFKLNARLESDHYDDQERQ